LDRRGKAARPRVRFRQTCKNQTCKNRICKNRICKGRIYKGRIYKNRAVYIAARRLRRTPLVSMQIE
jgi:hypothetical protein